MLARLWRRWCEYRQRRQQVWPVPRPEEAAVRDAAFVEHRRIQFEEDCDRHGGRGLFACVNGDAAIFMGPAHYEALDYLRKELGTS